MAVASSLTPCLRDECPQDRVHPSCQYTSLAFGTHLQAAGLRASLGSVGDAYDNAVVDAFFATLKTELVDRFHWPSRATAQRAIFAYIAVWYNRQRRHSS